MKYPTHPKGRQRPLAAPARGMCGIFHEGCFPSLISQGNGVILRVFLYWLVYFTCICRIDEKLVTQRKLIFNPRKAWKRLGHKNWEAFADKKFWSTQKGRNELRIVYYVFNMGNKAFNSKKPQLLMRVDCAKWETSRNWHQACGRVCPQTWEKYHLF